MTTWSAPQTATRTGAAHLRREQSCQDASGWLVLEGSGRGTDGGPVWAMVVADGHGGARYRRSRDGSHIACEVTLELVAEHFAPGKGAALARDSDPAALSHFVQEELSEAIVGLWQERIQRHWQENPDPTGEPFTPFLYGTTLALVLLTPRWWAHTGLGDWDLVRIEADGSARLISEEGEVGGGGEATSSLCLADAALRFHSRTRVHGLDANEPSFSLLLSTDGIRKSCTTDADYLNLARHFVHAAYASPQELPSDLDRISSQGSGDDVSVAISRWGALPEGSGPQARRRRRSQPEMRIEQPAPIQEGVGEPVESPVGVHVKPHAGARHTRKPSSLQQVRSIWVITTSLIGHAALVGLAWMAISRLVDPSQRAGPAAQPSSPLPIRVPSGVLRKPPAGASAEQAQLLCSEIDLSPEQMHRDGGESFVEPKQAFPDKAKALRNQGLKLRVEKADNNQDKLTVQALISWIYDPETGSFSEASLLHPARGVQACDALRDALRTTWRTQGNATTSPGEPPLPPQSPGSPSAPGKAEQR
ncbi:MAG: protein phosphatase 2C domain-containing protein [Cyanobium sp.]